MDSDSSIESEISESIEIKEKIMFEFNSLSRRAVLFL